MSPVPREILTYGPGSFHFRPADYPWLTAIRVVIQGAQAGASSDGTPGPRGETVTNVIPADQLPPTVDGEVGAGGCSFDGASRGDHGILVVELYYCDIAELEQ